MKPGLNITELAQLAIAISRGHENGPEPTLDQVNRVIGWAEKVRRESSLLSSVLAGDFAVHVPKHGAGLTFEITKQGKDKLQASLDAALAPLGDLIKRATEKKAKTETKAAEPKPAPAPATQPAPVPGAMRDSTDLLRSILDDVFGKQNAETIIADAERAKKAGLK